MRASIVAAVCLPLALTGCSLTTTAPPSPIQGAALSGSVHGGQQPISGAHVYLFAANTTGYGGAGIAASSTNASVSLLSAVSTGHSDSLGAYVLTAANGSFSISGDYTCTPNTQVYAYALGGDPGAGGVNSHAALMAALGNCPSAGNFVGAISFINMNEVTTVATAYALAGFAADATHVSSSGTALAQTGIQNAFANAANLASLSAGAALATTPGGNGTAPQSEINTLGNIIAACINSDGTISGPTNPTACYTLFNNATADGTPSGTQPTDTATAAINIAHNPGANVATLFNLPTAQSPFAPVLASAPNDWTVGIQFAEGSGTDCNVSACDPTAIAVDSYGNIWAANNGNGSLGTVTQLGPDGSRKSPILGYSDGTSARFDGIAVDLNGDVWVPSYAANCLVKFTGAEGPLATGTVLSPPGGFTGGGLNGPQSLAIDGSNNIWVANFLGNSISEYSVGSSNWVSSTGYNGGTLLGPWSVAIDHSGNAWIANNSTSENTVTELVPQTTGPPNQNSYSSIGGISLPNGVAIDASGNVWIADVGANGDGNVAELSNAGSAISPFSGYTGGGVNQFKFSSPQIIAIDGAGNAWEGDQSLATIAEFANNGMGTPISPSTGYAPPGIVFQTTAIAVDGSGDVWLADHNEDQLVELIGAAAPVVTPLSVATKNNTLGTRP